MADVKIKLSIDTEEARSRAKSLIAELQNQQVNIKSTVDTSQLVAKIAEANKQITDLNNKAKDIRLDIDNSSLKTKIAESKDLITSLQKERTKLLLEVDNEDAKSKIKSISQQIKDIKELIANDKSQLKVDTVEASSKLSEIKATIKSIESDKKVLIKADANQAQTEIKGLIDQAKLAGSQLSAIKISGDKSGISDLVSRLDQVKQKASDISKQGLNVKDQTNLQNLQNSLTKAKQSIEDVKNNKISIQANLSGNFQNDINSIKNGVNGIPRFVVVGIALAGIKAALDGIGAILSGLAQIGSSGLDYVSGIEGSTTALGVALGNQQNALNSSNKAFAEGKGTVEDYATITGKTTESLYETVEAHGSAGGASKAYKIDLAQEKGELLDLKQETQGYSRELKDLNLTKKQLENATQNEVKSYKVQIDTIENVIKSIQKEEDSKLKSLSVDDTSLKSIERLIKKKEEQIRTQENSIKTIQEEQAQKLKSLGVDDIALRAVERQIQAKERAITVKERAIQSEERGISFTQKQITTEESAITTLEKKLSLQERLLNNEINNATKNFDKDNKGATNSIRVQELEIRKKDLVIQKQIDSLNNNPTANAVALASLKDQKEELNQQNNALKIQKDELTLQKDIILEGIRATQESKREDLETQKEAILVGKVALDNRKEDLNLLKEAIGDKKEELARQKELVDADKIAYTDKKQQNQDIREQYTALIETKKDEIEVQKQILEKDKELYNSKKQQNEDIKEQFKTQIETQKTLIDNLKDKIEDANIKLDLNLEPFNAKIEQVQASIQDLQDRSQEVQNDINDKQQAQSEASAGASGGGGRGKPQQVLKASVASAIAKNQGKEFVPLSDAETQDKLQKIVSASTAFASKTPFEKKDVLSLTAQLETFRFNTLKGTDKTGGDISKTGYDNILNVASDFIARRLQISGGTSAEANKNFIKAIGDLKTGQTQSFAEQFGTTGNQLLSAGNKLGFNLKDQKDLANLDTDQLTQVLATVAKKNGIEGSALSQVQTLSGLESNLKDAGSTLFESFFGTKDKPTISKTGNLSIAQVFEEDGLGNSIKKTITNLTELLNGPEGSKLRESLKQIGNDFGDLLNKLTSKDNLQAIFETLRTIVNGISKVLTKDNINGFASAITQFAKELPKTVETFGAIIEKVAGFLGIETSKIKNERLGRQANDKNILGETALDRAKQSVDFIEKSGRLENGKVKRNQNENFIEKIANDDFQKEYDKQKQIVKETEEYIRAQALETSTFIQVQHKKSTDEQILNLQNLITKNTENFKFIQENGKNAFVELANGSKISLDKLGLDSSATTDQVNAKFITLKTTLTTALLEGRIESKDQLNLLSQLTGESVAEISLKYNPLKNDLIKAFQEGKQLSQPELEQLGLITGTTVDQLTLKMTDIKNNLQKNFNEGKALSDQELQQLAIINGTTVDALKLKQTELRDNLQTSFREGKDLSQKELEQLSIITGTSVENLKIQLNKNREAIATPITEGSTTANIALKKVSESGVEVKNNISKINDVKFNDLNLSFSNILLAMNPVIGGVAKLLEGLLNIKNNSNINVNVKEKVTKDTSNVSNKYVGNLVLQASTGGLITGGSGVRDDVPIMAMAGEFMLRQKSARQLDQYDPNLLQEINNNPEGLINRLSSNVQQSTANYYRNESNQNINNAIKNNSSSTYSPTFNVPQSSGDTKLDVFALAEMARRQYKNSF